MVTLVKIGGPRPEPTLQTLSHDEAWCGVGLTTAAALLSVANGDTYDTLLLPLILLLILAAGAEDNH